MLFIVLSNPHYFVTLFINLIKTFYVSFGLGFLESRLWDGDFCAESFEDSYQVQYLLKNERNKIGREIWLGRPRSDGISWSVHRALDCDSLSALPWTGRWSGVRQASSLTLGKVTLFSWRPATEEISCAASAPSSGG